jgi:hypothetical protein
MASELWLLDSCLRRNDERKAGMTFGNAGMTKEKAGMTFGKAGMKKGKAGWLMRKECLNRIPN